VIYKNFTTIIGIVGILVAIVSSSVTFANAANIYCTKERVDEDLTTWCFGTPQKDSIAGNSNDNNVVALGGNDIVDLGAGEDGSCGGPGDDKIAGGNGPDTLIGDGVYGIDIPLDCGNGHGADQLIGGSRNDQITHGDLVLDNSQKVVPSQMIISDGHTDFIDCGPGDDEAFINISIDHDIAKNCEQVRAG
jgi:Ca2+-binding RTX toxin-like protein